MSQKLRRSMQLVLGALATIAALSVAQATPAAFRVPIDQARPLRLTTPAAGVVIGNPSIAGVSLQSDKLLFVTGRSYGTTNLIVVDSSGKPVYESLISVVTTENPATVLVTRGVTTVRNECSPRCRQTPDVADDSQVFDQVKHQAEQHASQAKQ